MAEVYRSQRENTKTYWADSGDTKRYKGATKMEKEFDLSEKIQDNLEYLHITKNQDQKNGVEESENDNRN